MLGDETDPQYLRLTPQDADLISDLTAALNRFCLICETGENPGKRMLEGAREIVEAAGTITTAVEKLAANVMVIDQAVNRQDIAAQAMSGASFRMEAAGDHMAAAAARMGGY